MSNVSSWSKTAANNADVSPAGAQPGWTGSDVGPWARETMGGVARWYNDALWTALLFDNVGSPNSNKNASIEAAPTLHLLVNGLGVNGEEHFPQGRLIKVISGGNAHPGFVVSTVWNSGTLGGQVDVTVKWLTAGPPQGVVISQEDVLFAITGESATSGHYSKATEALGGQLIGPTILSGGGATTIRDAKFPVVANLPDGILWYNTTLGMLQATSGGAWVSSGEFTDSGGELILDSPAGNPTLSLKEAGTQTSKLYHDLANNRLALENGDWSTGTGDHGRVYIDDADGKLYHQTKSAATTADALSLTPGPDQGLEAEFLGGGIQNASYVAAADTTGVVVPLNQYVEKTFQLTNALQGKWGSVAHGATIIPKIVTSVWRCKLGEQGYATGDEFNTDTIFESTNATYTIGSYPAWSATDVWVVSARGFGNLVTRKIYFFIADPANINRGGMVYDALTPSSWEMVVRMWW